MDPTDQRGCSRGGDDVQPFISGLKAAGIEVDRKILADLAVTDSAAFAALVAVAKPTCRPTTLRPPEVTLSQEGIVASDAVGALRRHEPTHSEAIDVAAASHGGCDRPRRLLRHKERQLVQRFLAEGRQAISEALHRPGTVLELIVGDDSVDRHLDLLRIASKAGVPISAAPAQAMTELAATVRPQGLIAVCRWSTSLPMRLSRAVLGWSLCDQVRDPGNSAR